ncbi:Bug family tripartite tricarboxylate transporter substrate binding protein [Roseococcus sp. YIM B11640]|uniref:Bug family tripartite tricarboxylate transporter substrate binding protein n=1 Tax=Roseococcus sp. YIM B11640 TaxID=3133973 RepID=UPI003C7C5018
MTITRRGLVAAPLLAAPALAQAQSSTTALVIPYSPGGASDVVGRILAEGLTQRLGGSFVLDHKPGASTTIAARTVARARPDGQTLLVGTVVTFAMAPLALRNPGYDPIEDFTAITALCDTHAMLVANPRWRSLEELFAAAKARPGQLSYASWGIGTTAHLPMLDLTGRAGVEMLHVPYNGAPPALTDVIAGRADCMIALLAASRGHIEEGRVRALGTVSTERLPAFPNIPTVAEQGFPGFGGGAWYALHAPPNLPAPIKARLGSAAAESFNDPRTLAFMESQGLGPTPTGEAALVERIRRELAQNRELMQRAGITPG